MFPELQNFTSAEFDCKCGECGVTGQLMDPEFLLMLDYARGMAGIPFRITSGARCANHNAKVGGSATSTHLKFSAADIAAPTSRQRFIILRALLDAGFERIGIHETYIHAETSEDKPQEVAWLY